MQAESIPKTSKYSQVKVKLLPEDLEHLTFLASKENLKPPAFIRKQFNFSLNKKDERKSSNYKNEKIIIHKADPKLIYEIAKIGANLNQISKYLNQNKDINILQSLVNIESDIKKLLP